jgi:hypothetical protein
MVLPLLSGRLETVNAASSAEPDEIPTRIPSSLARRRAAVQIRFDQPGDESL